MILIKNLLNKYRLSVMPTPLNVKTFLCFDPFFSARKTKIWLKIEANVINLALEFVVKLS